MVESNDLLARAFSAIWVGGQETLQKPPVFLCADQTHEPFRVVQEPAQFVDGGDQHWCSDSGVTDQETRG